MKRILVILLLTISALTNAFSQNEVDALRYSQPFLTGTARAVSMGGAFGSLGGNFSAISLNPAGIGVYRSSEFSITPAFSYNLMTSDYNGNNYEDFKYDFELSNMSVVGTVKSKSDKGWESVSFGFGYNRTNNFDMNMSIKNKAATSSILDEWVSDANNGNWSNIGNQLASSADLIYQNPGSDEWRSDFTGTDYGQSQTRTSTSTGSTGEYTFALGANYKNMVYIGGSLVVNSLRYEDQTNHKESDINDNIDYLNSFIYENHLETRGTGTTFKIGAIVKPIDWVRLGLAIHTPTFYNLRDEYSSALDANLTYDNGGVVRQSGSFDYNLVTPFKVVSSLSFIINKFAILSFDYEFVDYTKSRLRTGGDGYDFEIENSNIQNIYTATGNIKAGGEVRFGPLSLRGGVSYYGSPYSLGELNEDSDYMMYGAGFGINSNNFYFDMAYSLFTNSQYYVLYHLPNSTVSKANLTYNSNQVLATIGLRF